MTRCDKNYSAKLLFLCLSHSGPVTVCKLASIKDPSLRSTAEGPREPLSLHLEEKVTFGQGTLRTQHGGQRQSHVKQPELFGEWQVIGGGWAGEVKGEPGRQASSGLGGLAQLRRRTAVGTAQSRP